LASIQAVGNDEGRQIDMQAAYLKSLLTCDNPTLLKQPPDHLPLAEFAFKPYIIWAKDLEPDGAAREARQLDGG
jgi:hypothetical protein